jgi:DNA uptake protein ComE-like DNA-binding protein
MGRVRILVVVVAALATLGSMMSLSAQTQPAQSSSSQPLLDPNKATEKELTSVPHITPGIAKAIVSKRTFATVVELDALLKEHKLTPEQLTEVHGRLFVPLNLNSASDGEILAIPGIGKRMLHEFKEYRPYKSMEQFRREIGKYIDRDKREAELARLERYVTIK